MAKAEGKETPTTKHVKRGAALEETRNSVFQSPYAVVSQMVETGSITADLVQQIVQA